MHDLAEDLGVERRFFRQRKQPGAKKYLLAKSRGPLLPKAQAAIFRRVESRIGVSDDYISLVTVRKLGGGK